MVQSMQLVFQKIDPNHPFEGSYFNPEEPNSKIEIIYSGLCGTTLAKQMESIRKELFHQVAEKLFILKDVSGHKKKNGKNGKACQ